MSEPTSPPLWSVAICSGRLQAIRIRESHPAFYRPAAIGCVLESTKPTVLAELAKRTAAGVNAEPFLLRKAGQLFTTRRRSI